MPRLRTMLLVAALCGLAGAAHAGLYYPTGTAQCGRYADGGGYCYGDLMGFRNTSNPNDYLQLYYNIFGTNGFVNAYLNGQSFMCYTDTPKFASTYLGDWNYLWVEWNASGRCTLLYFDRISFAPFAR